MLRKPQDNSNYYYLYLIVVSALIIRLIGINHGFPIIYHPDEPALVRSALALRFNINPGHFDWPHLFIYLNYFVYKVFAYLRDAMVTLGLKEQLSVVFPLIWNDNIIFYLISRIFVAIIGALTVIPVYFAGKTLFNERTGLLSALVLAVLPFHVRYSHYALTDVPMVFFISWSLYFIFKTFFSTDLKNYLLAGLFIGFAASTKYNGALVSVMVPLVYLFRTLYFRVRLWDLKGFLGMILSGVMAAIGFVAGTPFSVLDYKTFIRTDGPVGALWQFSNVGKVELPEHLSQFSNILTERLPGELGYVFMFLYVGLFLVVLVKLFSKKFSRDDLKIWLLIIPSFLSFYYVSGFIHDRSHYYMMSYPFICIGAAYALYKLQKYLGSVNKLVLGVVFAIPLFVSIMNINQMVSRTGLTPEATILEEPK